MEKFGLFRLLQSNLLQRLGETTKQPPSQKSADSPPTSSPEQYANLPLSPEKESPEQENTHEVTHAKQTDAYARFIARQEAFSKKIKPR